MESTRKMILRVVYAVAAVGMLAALLGAGRKW